MSCTWPAEYKVTLQEREGRHCSPGSSPHKLKSRAATSSLRRSPSKDTLFVDVFAEPLSATSNTFLDSLVHHQKKESLETIDEVLGLGKSPIEKGSLTSCIFTMVASAMGAGCLSLPHMFQQAGLGLGLVLLACGAVLAHISLVVLMSCARYTHCRSFAELVSLSTSTERRDDNEIGRSLMVDTVIALFGMAAVLIYMMLLGDFLEGVMQSPFLGFGCVPRQSLILGSLVVLFPLSVPKNITALRYLSMFSVSSTVFLTVVVLIKTPGLALQNVSDGVTPSEENVFFCTGSFLTIVKSFSIALFSFNAHTNAVPVVVALDQPSAARIWRVSLVSVLIEFGIYSLIATCGYLSFRGATQQDFIRNYSTDDTLMFVVRCVYSVPVLLGVPINLSPAAASMQALARSLRSKSSDDVEHDPLETGFLLKRQVSDSLAESSLTRHVLIVASVLALCAAVAISSEAVADTVGLVGGCFGTLVCSVWPLIIYRRVLGNLHSKTLSIIICLALMLASIIGALAFVSQLQDVLASLL
eukprot:TRINITY_DN30993_c0_g1_i1.p1 TRINITY_DN30993_c0_g1~~TRINITY_DN30993_c0_g1_i1.p1  ORF type:complete len:538 (+),score=73.05 TRINITY_DN30993_c0_g1_i1:31-1614(+)